MSGVAREHSWSVIFSVLLHGLLVLGFVLTAMVSERRDSTELQPLPIDAVVVESQVLQAAQKVNSDRIEQEQARIRAADEARAAAAAKVLADAAAAQEDDARAAQEAAAAAQAKTDAAEETKAAAAATAVKAAAQQQQQALDARKAALASKAAALDADRIAAAEAAKKIEAAKQAAAKQAQESRQAAEAKLAADARKAADDKARQDREAELRRQLADEERRSAIQSGPLRDQYVASLRNSIQRAWIKPPSANAGIDCLVEVTQVPGGAVTTARVTQCNGDAAVRQSIENAVYRASPLPDPPDPALFERTFVFRFKPND